jgi:hypothetical protein
MRFPCEVVTGLEIDLWQRAIVQVVTDGPAQVSLGAFKTDSHKLWEWHARQHRSRVEVYCHIRRRQYTHLCTSHSRQMQGVVATVEKITPETVKVCSVASLPVHPITPVNFLDVLCSWGQTWIWDDLKVTGGTDWVAQAIIENILMVVTDGSYIREYQPNLCFTAFVLKCTQG